MVEAESFCILWVDFERLFWEEIVDASAAPGLGASMVGFKATSCGKPDGKFVADYLRRIAIADDLENTTTVFEFFLVKARCAGVIFIGTGHWYSLFSMRSQSNPA